MDDPAAEQAVGESIDDDSGMTLFGDDELFHTTWQEWQGMPEFSQADLQPWGSVVVNFASEDDLKAFQQLVGQTFPWPRSRGIWYPELKITHFMDKRYRQTEVMS